MDEYYVTNGIAVDRDQETELLNNGCLGDDEVSLVYAPRLGDDEDLVVYLQTNGNPVILHADMDEEEIDAFCDTLGYNRDDIAHALEINTLTQYAVEYL